VWLCVCSATTVGNSAAWSNPMNTVIQAAALHLVALVVAERPPHDDTVVGYARTAWVLVLDFRLLVLGLILFFALFWCTGAPTLGNPLRNGVPAQTPRRHRQYGTRSPEHVAIDVEHGRAALGQMPPSLPSAMPSNGSNSGGGAPSPTPEEMALVKEMMAKRRGTQH
jgi:hypothetical protein